MKSFAVQITLALASLMAYCFAASWWWHFYGPIMDDWLAFPALLSTIIFGALSFWWPMIYHMWSES